MAEPSSGVPWVIVLNYRRPDLTELCLESLERSHAGGIRVVVIDNDSPDDGARLRAGRAAGGVVVVPTRENLGFAGGMNVGLRMALEAQTIGDRPSSVTVLNNDTIMPEGGVFALDKLATASGGLVSPSIVRQDPEKTLWFGGGTVDPHTNFPRHLNAAEVDALPKDDYGVARVEVLSGCCLTAAPAVWRLIGLFDERFFLNFEDSELSKRASDASVPRLVDFGVRLEHVVSASFAGPHDILGAYYYTRNGLVFSTRILPGGYLTALRLLMRHVYPNIRPGGVLTIGRSLAAGVGIVDYVRGRYGKAPRLLERVAHVLWRLKRSRRL